jgi:hypothetical protein
MHTTSNLKRLFEIFMILYTLMQNVDDDNIIINGSRALLLTASVV